MANIKISELSALTTPDGAAEVLVNASGTSKKITITDLTSASLPLAGGTMTGNITGLTALDVAGTVTANDLTLGDASPTIFFNDSDIANLSHYITSASNANLYYAADSAAVATGKHVFTTQNVERFEISSTGVDVTGTVIADGLGIGVVPEAWAAGTEVLQVGQSAALWGWETNTNAYFSNNTYYDGAWKYINTDEATRYNQENNGTHSFMVAPSGTEDTAISWTTAMTIDNSGALLHGTSTAGAAGAGDIVVAGAVYLGGAGAANKLDYYEEGTWTPTVTHGTVNSSSTVYVRVGGLVTVTGTIYGFSDTTTLLLVAIGGLPFNTNSGANGAGSVFFRYINHSADQLSLYSPGNSASLKLYSSNKTGNYPIVTHAELSTSSLLNFTITYAV